jgi:hypothetical protein
MVPDKIVDLLSPLVVPLPGNVVRRPRIAVNPGTIIRIGRPEQVVKVEGNSAEPAA